MHVHCTVQKAKMNTKLIAECNPGKACHLCAYFIEVVMMTSMSEPIAQHVMSF